MALTNYAELKSSIADFLNRDDLTSVIPTFISLAEAQFARDLRHYKMENRATGTIDSQFMTKPCAGLPIDMVRNELMRHTSTHLVLQLTTSWL